jgi:UDP-N-acetylmuramoyl-tripeptide--D-alanyl-D-alanine ligase
MIEKIYTKFIESNKISTDTRRILPNSIFFALKGANFNANKFAKEALEKGASLAIIDEAKYQVNNKYILVNDVLETLQQLATHHRKQLNIPVIALTGSNGKTTTKELINVVLAKKFKITATIGNLNNHIGVPLTLLSMDKNTQIGIVEMGANHPKEIEFLCNITKPDYGYITNFGKAHLEGFGSIAGVIKAKTELYQYLEKNNKIVFINNNDSIQVEKSKRIKSVSFGTKKAKYPITLLEANPNVKLQFENINIQSNLIGTYNFNNIAAAIAIGNYFNVEVKAIKNAIESYYPTNNRSQIIIKGNTKIILDAYNANPSSMQSALENFIQLNEQNKIAILGDMFELGDYAEEEHQKISDFILESTINKIYLIGEHFRKTKNQSQHIILLNNYDEFKNSFKKSNFENSTILIKASRGMALERIVQLFD